MSDTQGQTPEATPHEGAGADAAQDAAARPTPTPEPATPEAPAASSVGADGSAGPAAPAGPAGTVAPAGPAGTAAPAGPAGPIAPAGPIDPAGPAAPAAPAAPGAQDDVPTAVIPPAGTPGAAPAYVYGTPAYPQAAPAPQSSAGHAGAPQNAAPHNAAPHNAAPHNGVPPQGVPPVRMPYPAQPHPGQPYAGAAYAGTPLGQSATPGAAFGPAGQPHVATAPSTGTPAAHKPAGTGAKVAGILVAAALVGGGAGIGGAALWSSMNGGGQERASGPVTAIVNNPETATLTTEIAAKVVPSVVTLDVSGRTQAGSGSGVILSSDGYVLTNTHVVTLDGAEGQPTIRATTSDGRIYTAKLVGTDPLYDLAVVKLVDASGLTPIEFANSSALNVGDRAIAVGAPLGLSSTVTDGIVSALNRSIEIASSAAPDTGSQSDQRRTPTPTPEQSETPDEGTQPDTPWFFDLPGQTPRAGSETISIAVIQTDAAINPGNSGGALVNGKGQLIGINVAIATASGTGSGQAGSIGVGFAIPSNVAERVSAEIIESGTASHGLLGATVRAASSEADATVAGALIHEVTPDGAAAKAGLAPGDIVTEFGGAPITSAVDLTAQVRAAAGGSTAELSYVRGGATHTVEVTLGTL